MNGIKWYYSKYLTGRTATVGTVQAVIKRILQSKMVIVLFLLFAILASCSCKKEDPLYFTHELKDCRVGYLFFGDDIAISGNQSFSFPPDDSSNTMCSYSYSDGKMVKSTGGFFVIPSGSNFSNQIFSGDAYDSICQVGRTISVFIKYKINGSVTDDRLNPIVFNIDSTERLRKITRKDAFHPNGYDLNYSYGANQVIETDSDGNEHRKFYFETGNLIKVVSEVHDLQGVILTKKEILFQEFDNNPNPFKNRYFIKGAFFRAFSENNYKSCTINEYTRSSDSTLVLTSNYWYTTPFQYTTGGYPAFGDYE